MQTNFELMTGKFQIKHKEPNLSENRVDSQVQQQIKRWKERLIDLSRRNRLIYYKSGRTSLSIEHPEFDVIFYQFAVKNKSFNFWHPSLPPELLEEYLGLLYREETEPQKEIPNPIPPKETELKTR